MDSEEPPNVRVACSGDIDEVVRLMHDAAAWMSAKGTPAWDVARIDRTFAETFVLRSELLVASCSDGIVGCCTLSAEDPEFWPDALKGEAAYLHKLAVRRTHAGRGVSSALIEACRHAARTQGCAKLRLDCHPNLRGLYGYRKFNRPFLRVWRVGSGRASAALGTDRAQIGGSCVGFRHRGAAQRLSA